MRGTDISSITGLGRWGRIGLVAVLCALLAPATALGAKRIAMVPPEDAGPADAPIQAKIAKVLKKQKIQVVPAAQVKKATKKDGLPSADEDWVKLARKLKVDGFVEMTLSQTGLKRRVEIRVRNGEDGALSVRENFAAKGAPKKLAATVAGGFWKKLGTAVRATSGPKKDAGAGLAARDLPPGDASGSGAAKPGGEEEKPAGEPEKVAAGDEDKEDKQDKKEAEDKSEPKADEEGAEKKEDEEAEEEPVRRRARGDGDKGKKADDESPRALEVEVGARVMQRLFQYAPTAGTPRYYSLPFTPLAYLRAAWFPITYVGVFVSGEYNPALKSGAFPTATRELVAGGQVRLPFSMGQIGASGAFFQHLFVLLDTASQTDAPRSSVLNVPNTTYVGARFALNGRLRLGDYILLGAEGAYRLVTNPGSPTEGIDQVRSANFFPNGIVTAALDGSAFVGISVMRWLEIRVGADYRRYILGQLRGSSTPGLAAVQSAADDYLGFTVGVVGVLGGK